MLLSKFRFSYYRPFICSSALRFSTRRSPFDHRGSDADRRKTRAGGGGGTIFALSSGGGKCGVQVFRVSGPGAGEVVRIVGRFRGDLPQARKAILRRFFHPKTGQEIDRGLLLWFPGPSSFTGEDCCELHVHGGSAVASAVVDALGSLSGLRYAVPGEFTRRSFQNGKLDLTEVEGIADLINAETEAQRRLALRQMDGALTKLYATWKDKILKSVAHLEAFIDFSEEENIEDGVTEAVLASVIEVQQELQRHLEDSRRGERLRAGVHVTIVGRPNVGKSSLLNTLCRRPTAMVSPVAGTTRDVIETTLNISGYPVVISDTAGLRHTNDELESEGVRRALERSKASDLLVLVVDVRDTSVQRFLSAGHSSVDRFASDLLRQLGVAISQSEGDIERPEVILLLNKDDLIPERKRLELLHAIRGRSHRTLCCLGSCCAEGGLNEFLNLLAAVLQNLCDDSSMESPMLTNDRHRLHLVGCLNFLTKYVDGHRSTDCVLGAEALRRAVRQMAKVTGHVTTTGDDVLDVIFKDFCIGK